MSAKFDGRPRCKRCGKIPRSRAQKANIVKHYPGYCSYHCQEWHNLELAARALSYRELG